jgi:hypothetical protein
MDDFRFGLSEPPRNSFLSKVDGVVILVATQTWKWQPPGTSLLSLGLMGERV